MPVCTPPGQGLSAQLSVEEGHGKPPHHHPSTHFPSLDDTVVSPLSVITDLPYGRALIIIIIIMSLLSRQSTPILFNTSNIFTQFTLSKAFSKSTKHTNTSLSNSKLLSHSILNTPVASRVPQPFLKPN